MAESDTFYRKYRPKDFSEVKGQGPIIKSLKTVIAEKSAQSFLFTGPSGTGKTTLARIVSRAYGCDETTIREVDAASHTGVDAMRAIADTAMYMPFGEAKMKAIIIDECHRLSGQAWDTILKATEEPPPHVIWIFCTTEPGKVRPTIKTRCASYNLKAVANDYLHDIMQDVCEAEGIELASGVASLVVKASKGSPRQMLSDLAKCYMAKNRAEAAQLLESAIESEPVLELCRLLVSNQRSFMKALVVVNKLEDVQPESVRIQVTQYVAAGLRGAKTEKEAAFFLAILGEFDTSYSQSDGVAPLLLSIGRCLFNGG